MVYWIAIMAWVRLAYGDIYTAFKMAYTGLTKIEDDELKPQPRTRGSIEKLKREYGEFDDVPVKATQVFTKLEKAKALIAFLLSYGMTDDGAGLKQEIMKTYNLSPAEIEDASDWYAYYAAVAAYKQNNVDLWFYQHNIMPMNNMFKLVRTDPDGARRVYRRLMVLSEEPRLKHIIVSLL